MSHNKHETTNGNDKTISIQKPKEPLFNIDGEISRIQDEMRRLNVTSKKGLDKQEDWKKAHNESILKAMEGQVKTPRQKDKQVTREYLEEMKREFNELGIDKRIKKTIQRNPRSALSARADSFTCASDVAPYSGGWSPDPDTSGLALSDSHLDNSIGQFGGYEFVVGGNSIWEGTGVGDWVYSGSSGGIASVYANISVYGRAVEYSVLGYAHNIVRVHVLTWDSSGVAYNGQQTVRDNDKYFGIDLKDFLGDSFTPTAFSVPIDPYRWYFIWAWAEQYTY